MDPIGRKAHHSVVFLASAWAWVERLPPPARRCVGGFAGPTCAIEPCVDDADEAAVQHRAAMPPPRVAGASVLSRIIPCLVIGFWDNNTVV